MSQLDRGEALCLSAHGNDTLIGDSGAGSNDWTWSVQDIANLLAQNCPTYQGQILISACATNVVNFSSNLAVKLISQKALNGVWIYGYNRPVPSHNSYPEPSKLARQVDLQGTQVLYQPVQSWFRLILNIFRINSPDSF